MTTTQIAWRELASSLPVPVTVWHNWTARHCEFYQQGADHIIPLAPIKAGRTVRVAREPLCSTPSRARSLRHVFHNGETQHERVPTCKACLRLAERLTHVA